MCHRNDATVIVIPRSSGRYVLARRPVFRRPASRRRVCGIIEAINPTQRRRRSLDDSVPCQNGGRLPDRHARRRDVSLQLRRRRVVFDLGRQRDRESWNGTRTRYPWCSRRGREPDLSIPRPRFGLGVQLPWASGSKRGHRRSAWIPAIQAPALLSGIVAIRARRFDESPSIGRYRDEVTVFGGVYSSPSRRSLSSTSPQLIGWERDARLGIGFHTGIIRR